MVAVIKKIDNKINAGGIKSAVFMSIVVDIQGNSAEALSK